jgi:hypothetical protein
VQAFNIFIYATTGNETAGGAVKLKARMREVPGSHLGTTASFSMLYKSIKHPTIDAVYSDMMRCSEVLTNNTHEA